jgi:AraC-like DNA-binding protein
MMPSEEPPITRLEVSNPEDFVSAVKSAIFEPCLLERGAMTSVLARVVCPRVTLDFVRLGSSFLFTGVTSKDCHTLMFVLDCPVRGRSFNFGIDHHDGYMALFPPGGNVDALTPSGYSNATLSVPSDVFLREVESMVPEIPDHVIENGLGFRLGRTVQKNLRNLLMEVTSAISDPTMPLAGLPAKVELERRLLDGFLGSLIDGIGDAGRRLSCRPAGSQKRLREARTLLEASVHQPLHLDALCRELRMSRRGLEILFRRSLGTSPGRYLQAQRLNGVRRALIAADPSSTMVKQVALDWGFVHMGHFGQNYRAFFGETALSTLERV